MIGKSAILNMRSSSNSPLVLWLAVLPYVITSLLVGCAARSQHAGQTLRGSDEGSQRASLEQRLGVNSEAVDADGDGLSDFQEIHKYFTDPAKKDTDGDGVPDGDWDERREYTYSVRSILQFMPPFDHAALSDDFQDARVLEERDDHIELEVVHYPLSTAYESIGENLNWQRDYAGMAQYLKPGITTNWDAEMRQRLLAELKDDGIVPSELTDKQVVGQVSSWLMKKSKYLDHVFTTYYVYFPNSRPSVFPGLEDAFEREFNRDKENYDWAMDQHFDHELLGKGMFYNKTHGSCTSFAIYLSTVLRAVGIPTRMIIVVPAVDPSNEDQIRLVRERITHGQVRKTMLSSLMKSRQGFTAHTLSEVYVGGHWCRLNYNKLGQNILDEHLFGLYTHLYTFNDLSDANLAPTWGQRYGKGQRSVAFKHGNPYSAVILSDLYGCHSEVVRPPVKEHTRLTVSKAYWFHSKDRPDWIAEDAVKKDGDGHMLLHVDEWFEGEGIEQYRSFYSMVDKGFVLKAAGHPDVRASAERGYWNQEFYVRIPRTEYDKMVAGITYSICPVNSNPTYQWSVEEPVAIRKASGALPNIYVMSSSIPGFDVFGRIFQIVKDTTHNKTGRAHEKKSYDEVFIDGIWAKKPGDIIVLLFSLDTSDRIPAEYEDLLPRAWSEVKSVLQKEKTLELKSEAREMSVILLAAQTTEQLKQLVDDSVLLKALSGQDKKRGEPSHSEHWTQTGRTKGPVVYTVTIREGNQRKAYVRCEMVTEDTLSLYMNNNGAPRVSNGHANFVRNLKAIDSAGDTVPLRDFGRARWMMSPVRNQIVTLSYEVLLEHDKSDLPWGRDEAPYVTEDGAFWTGRALFIVADMNEITARFDLPAGWHVSTPWQPAADRASTFLLRDEDELTEAFVFAGTHIEEQAKVGDMDILLALGNRFKQSKEVLQGTTQKLLSAYVELFGGTVMGRTLIVLNNQDRKGSLDGGVFGRSVSMLMGDEPNEDNIERWAPFIAHEVFHLWNGQAIEHTGHENWFSEGFTDYYAVVMCARSGVISEQEFIRRLRRASERYFAKSGQRSIREARDYELQYAGGSLVGACLDIEIRKLTNNVKALDDLMRQMYHEFGKTGKKYSLEDVIRIANSITGTDLAEFFGGYVEGTDELPLEEYFGHMGLDLRKEIAEELPDQNYVIHKMLHIMSLRETQEKLLIRRSQEAGYEDEDYLTAVDGTPVGSFRDIQTVGKRLKPGDKIEVTLLRGGKDITMDITLGGEGQQVPLQRRVQIRIDKKTRLDDSQQAILSGITGQKQYERVGN